MATLQGLEAKCPALQEAEAFAECGLPKTEMA